MEMPLLLTENLRSATSEVFEMMIGHTVIPEPLRAEPPTGWTAHVAASVSFAGHRSGLVCLHASLDTARQIAGSMLGIEPAAVNGEMPDAMGEVANLVTGCFRSKLAAFEPASVIAIPTVTVGSDFSTRYAADTARVLLPFAMDGQTFYLELILMNR